MINIYDDYEKGRVKVFFKLKGDKVAGVTVGNRAVNAEAGIQFYVDDYISEQLNKCEFYMDGFKPILKVREGEQVFVPEENNEYKKRKEIKDLEEKIKKLKGDVNEIN